MKLTFKKQKRETGLASVARPTPDTNIKGDGLIVGHIRAPSRFGRSESKWSVSFAICKPVTNDDPCPFKWVRVVRMFDTEPEAREAVKRVWTDVEKRLHQFEKGYCDD